MLPRYVGNRLNVLFVLCANVFALRKKILEYLKTWCNGSAAFKDAIIADLENSDAIDDLHALGIIGKLCTGPWMNLTYSKDEIEHHHYDIIAYVKTALTKLDSISSGSCDLFDDGKDVFGENLKECAVLDILKNEINEKVKAKVSGLAKAVSDVIRRQMKELLDLEVTEELKERTRNATHDNIYSEEIMGMVDAALDRSNNANTDFIEATVRAVKNKTIEWYKIKTVEEKEQINSFVIKGGRRQRMRNKERVRECREKVIDNVKRKQQLKDDKSRKILEKKFKKVIGGEPLDAVFEGGFLGYQEQLVQDIIADPKSLQGKLFEQTFVEDDRSVKLYDGEIVEARIKRKLWRYTVIYGDKNDLDMDEYVMTLEEILSDIVTGNFLLKEYGLEP